MAKNKRGRPRKDGPRKADGTLDRGKFTPPPPHVLVKRSLYSFVTPAQGPEGRSGEIDQEVCDGIGQLHALGLLDGQPIDGLELRNAGREWRDWYVTLLRRQGFKAGGYERMDKARECEPRANERFDRMDDALRGFERLALMSLLIDPVVGSWPNGEENAPWVQSIICEALLKRGRDPRFCRLPSENDRDLLAGSIRGLMALYDEALPNRYERRAA